MVIDEKTRTTISVVVSVISVVVGTVGAIVAYRNYIEGRDQRELQKQLTILQIQKATQDLSASPKTTAA